ncbi:FG-GAP-like repeat-containing protein [bacterium BMS3Abin03]|nr:FG-GAP-like repeat-containing protein [bacterium BMS3Abin03]
MKKSFVFIIAVLLTTFQGSLLTTYGQWQKYTVFDRLDRPEIVCAGDLNGDSKLDLVLADLTQDRIYWFENSYPNWTYHTIDANLGGAYHVRIGDIDGDGDLDVVASGFNAKVVVWYENNNLTWTKHIIDTTIGKSGCVGIFDVDGDDTLDVVSGIYDNSFPDRDFVWYENNHSTWIKHIISTDCALGDFYFGDIDGDDTADVVVSAYTTREIVWYKNENSGTTWTKDIIDSNVDSGTLVLSDINGDNQLDLVATGYDDDFVVWYDNDNLSWTPNIIDLNLDRAHTVNVVDIDSDGQLDVVATGKQANKVVWYKNNNFVWEKIVIDSVNGPHRAISVDIDNDNDIDIVVPVTNEGKLVLYENQIPILPRAPLLIEPVNDTTLDSIGVQLVWHQSYPDVEKYWLELDTTDQFVIPIFTDSTLADTTLLYSSLQSNKNYWWRVKAYNSLGWSIFSEVRTFGVIITSIEDDDQLPTEFSLEQNFPNPFNPITSIQYQISELSFVNVKIFDVLGDEITTLVNEIKPTGRYEIEFDATNLSSGIYFYQLQAGSFIETKKMLLLK